MIRREQYEKAREKAGQKETEVTSYGLCDKIKILVELSNYNGYSCFYKDGGKK